MIQSPIIFIIYYLIILSNEFIRVHSNELNFIHRKNSYHFDNDKLSNNIDVDDDNQQQQQKQQEFFQQKLPFDQTKDLIIHGSKIER